MTTRDADQTARGLGGRELAADTDMLEYVCNENEKDTSHRVGPAKAVAQPSPSVLARYGGNYKVTHLILSAEGDLRYDQKP